MSRPDDGTRERAWDDNVPTFSERLRLAIRQNPIRGVVVMLLLLLSFSFLAAGFISFREAIWTVTRSIIASLFAGEPIALLAVALGLVAMAAVALQLQRD